MHTHNLLLLLCLLLIAISAAIATTGELPQKAILGGYAPIKNLSDPHVLKVVKFAMKQHNKQDPAHKLKLLKIIKGWSQVVAGINWKFIIYAKQVHTHNKNLYKVLVYERPWEHKMNLTSFTKIYKR